MAVPSVMADLSTTANSNSPAGTESPSNADDFLRAIQAIVRTTNAKGADIASATTTDIGAATGEFVDVTGTTTITGLGTVAPGIVRTVRFTGALTLTHNATSLILPGGANITTAANDRALFRSLGSGNWLCVVYQKADGTATVFNSINGLTAVEFDYGNDYAAISDGSDSNSNKKARISVSPLKDIDASVASNALTITINPTTLDFRSTTLTDGTPTRVTLSSPVTVTFPNGATGGTINGQSARFAVLAINSAGTIEAAAVNLAGGNQLDETNLITTTTIGTGADSNNVIYSTTGRTNVAYRVVGFIDITEANAGVWATAPTLVQPTGGQALAALSSLGYGQTWQDVKASRAFSTTYYNTTGKPISVSIYGTGTANAAISLTIGGLVISSSQAYTGTAIVSVNGIVPPGGSYSAAQAGGTITVTVWGELR
jgi:hypothetical protein